MKTVATRGVSLVVKAPTLEDVIKGVSIDTGTGDPNFILPSNIAAGDTVYAFLRLNKSITSAIPAQYAPNWGIFEEDPGLYSRAIVNNISSPFDVALLNILTRYADGTEAGDSVPFDLTMFNDAGAGSYVNYDGEWDVIIVVLNGEYYVNGGYPSDNPVELSESEVYGNGYSPFSGMTIPANGLTLWGAAGWTATIFNPTVFPTTIATTAALYVGAKWYLASTVIAEGGMTFSGGDYWAGMGFPVSIVG
jgi:hypothetical protein